MPKLRAVPIFVAALALSSPADAHGFHSGGFHGGHFHDGFHGGHFHSRFFFGFGFGGCCFGGFGGRFYPSYAYYPYAYPYGYPPPYPPYPYPAPYPYPSPYGAPYAPPPGAPPEAQPGAPQPGAPQPLTPPPPQNAPPSSGSIAPPAQAASYYYCPASKSYYPYVASCAVAWKQMTMIPPAGPSEPDPRYSAQAKQAAQAR